MSHALHNPIYSSRIESCVRREVASLDVGGVNSVQANRRTAVSCIVDKSRSDYLKLVSVRYREGSTNVRRLIGEEGAVNDLDGVRVVDMKGSIEHR